MTKDEFRAAAGIPETLAERWYPHVEGTLFEFGIASPERAAAFIAQIGHESAGFTTVAESFNYSPAGLRATFPTRITVEQAARFGRQPNERTVPMERQKQIANHLYGGRYGNNTAGDGWKFRGHGLKQITFHDNFLECGNALGVDLISNPDLLFQDEWAARSAGWFWFSHGCNGIADRGDFYALTVRINGGSNGIEDRRARWDIAKKALGAKGA